MKYHIFRSVQDKLKMSEAVIKFQTPPNLYSILVTLFHPLRSFRMPSSTSPPLFHADPLRGRAGGGPFRWLRVTRVRAADTVASSVGVGDIRAPLGAPLLVGTCALPPPSAPPPALFCRILFRFACSVVSGRGPIFGGRRYIERTQCVEWGGWRWCRAAGWAGGRWGRG